ncbi:phospholipid carrier-dependent glycosyltransferase [uncultured Sphingomonas sp.]|uniref:phospholipid carrier-dependent glycosyltransferase n=1 Tax=uncultured Sphingomonas sp. TaxID=158754 RepID=UPI00259355CF|nr:phospholipid carrier-dependent glycosyltransferase [uncultured Sphingomonas sp.]
MRALSRPLPAAAAIGLLAQGLFSWRLATPHSYVFDEVHYVPAAQVLGRLWGPTNTEHPLLGKTLIAFGIRVFGDDPVGWRALSTIAATGVVLGVFAILWLGLGRLRPAAIGSLLTLLDFTVFVQARIAMLDGFMAAFVVLGLAALLWAMRGAGTAVWWRWLLGAVLLGLAVGCKWTALPYIPLAGVGFLVLRRGRTDRWGGMPWWAGLAILGVASALVYFATFWPAFLYASAPLTLDRLLPFQLDMYRQQTEVLPPHSYQSAWYSWPFDYRPIWYLYERADGAQRGILMLGNPAVMWGGLVAVAACLWAGMRARAAAPTLAGLLWAASIAMWAIIPKSLGFFYYYYLSSIWLGIAIAVALDHWRTKLAYWDEGFLLLSAVLFVHFYPILAATALDEPGAFHRWMWLQSWI